MKESQLIKINNKNQYSLVFFFLLNLEANGNNVFLGDEKF